MCPLDDYVLVGGPRPFLTHHPIESLLHRAYSAREEY